MLLQLFVEQEETEETEENCTTFQFNELSNAACSAVNRMDVV
jgi:hypothetical protein